MCNQEENKPTKPTKVLLLLEDKLSCFLIYEKNNLSDLMFALCCKYDFVAQSAVNWCDWVGM